MRPLLAAVLVVIAMASSVAIHGSVAVAAEPVFSAVTPGKVLAFPEDTGAHPGFRTEWWYATGWLNDPDGKPLGFQITFFRSATGLDPADPSAFAPTQLIIAHAALSDPGSRASSVSKAAAASVTSASSAGSAATAQSGRYVHDQKIARQGFGLAYAKTGNTDVKVDAWRLIRAADGHYDVTVSAADFALNLALTPTQPPLLQGQNGYSRKGPLAQQASYYYSEPQLRVSGSVTRVAGGSGETVASGARTAAPIAVTGSAWLDHEWSTTVLSTDAVGWDWLGANLSDGAALMAFRVRGRQGEAVWSHAIVRDAAGKVTTFERGDVDFVARRTWRSPRTNVAYPVAMTVRTGGLEWQLDPLMDDQELDSRASSGTMYWEGATTVSKDGKPVGRGYLELTGYAQALKLDGAAK